MANSSIPSTQRVALLTSFKEPLQIVTSYPVPPPETLEQGQCLLRMEATGVCHSDVYITKGDLPTAPLPFVPGHEGIGTVVALAPGTQPVEGVDVGSRVGVKWIVYACGSCELCRTGFDPLCSKKKIPGLMVNGTFSEYMVASVAHVVPIPDGVPSEEAVPVLCAGLTAYKALKISNTKVGDWVAIPGAGGGLGHLAIQYAVAKGLRVLAIDSGESKRKTCLELGAESWLDFAESTDIVTDVMAACGGLGPHAAIVVSTVDRAYNDAVHYLRPAGTLVAVAIPSAAFKLDAPLRLILAKSLHIIGTVVGNLQDTIEALDLVARKKVRTHCTVHKLDEVNSIIREVEQGKITGRAVIRF
ncbi:chaperonin 10-like protein [Gloeopeniophorella convolvens]|nr:chaperonin 10-like protein [Gloeopeniophorella convolvens]